MQFGLQQGDDVTDALHSGIYAFTFDQHGLMAGLGLQGSKIMRID
jgi:hypothetical protein